MLLKAVLSRRELDDWTEKTWNAILKELTIQRNWPYILAGTAEEKKAIMEARDFQTIAIAVDTSISSDDFVRLVTKGGGRRSGREMGKGLVKLTKISSILSLLRLFHPSSPNWLELMSKRIILLMLVRCLSTYSHPSYETTFSNPPP